MSNPATTNDRAFLRIYDELRQLAQHRLAGLPAGQTLQATALVHEVWLRLAAGGADGDAPEFADAGHFSAAAAQAMRWILVDRARRRTAAKRPQHRHDVEPDQLPAASFDDGSADEAAIVRLDRALQELEKQDARRAQIVMLRHFAGLSVEDTAKALGISPATVKRDWQFARAWLVRQMDQQSGSDGSNEENREP